MSLVVDIRHRLGSFEIAAAFESASRLTALFGSSGAGKTSIINMIAGLIRPDAGRIVVDGHVLLDTAAGISVPTHRRRIGYVFQDARLFPHLTVARNLRYGRWFTPASERYADLERVIDLLGIGHLLDRRPEGLSGGERQRVAIGRALIASPRLLLMDEPLASLDLARKAEILPYVERLRDELALPIVYVSHSVAEVARLASEMVVLADGKVIASGPTGTVLPTLDRLPIDEHGEAGAVLELRLARQEPDFGLSVLASAGGEWHLPTVRAPIGSMVRVRVRARDVIVATARPRGISAMNILAGTIRAIAADGGTEASVSIDCGGELIAARITRHSVGALGLKPGRAVFAVIKAVTFDDGNMARADWAAA